MAAPPILLVADDLAVIAAVKRVLAREGYECILATSAADAVIAWGHALPGLVLLQPSVESERGAVVLEELQLHPDAQLLKIVLLGETVLGFPWPVEPLPLDPAHFVETIEDNIRSGTNQGTGWSVLETTPPAEAPEAPAPAAEPESWRATSPHDADPEAAAHEAVPEPTAITLPPTPPSALEARLFGDLAADVEAQAMQSVESSLNLPPSEDEELQRLEDEVRAEAQRRRQSREAHAVEVKPAPPTPPELPAAVGDESAEASFGELGESPSLAPSRAAEVLGRAEQMVLETRAQAEAHRRAEEADARRLQGELEAASRRAQHAEELVRSEREARSAGEEALATLKAAAENERELARVRHENALEEAEASRQALRQQVRGLEVALEDASRQVASANSSSADTVSAERAQRQALEARLAESGARLAQLEFIAQGASEDQQQRVALEQQLTTAVAHAEQLEAQLAQTSLAAEETAARAAQLERIVQQDRGALDDLLAESGTRATQLERELQQEQQLRAQLEAQLASAAQLEGALQREQRLRADIEAQLEVELQREQQVRVGVESQLAAMNARVASLERDVQHEQQQRATLEAQLATTAEDLHREQQQRAGVEETAEREQQQRATLEAQLATASGDLQRERQQRAGVEAQLAEAGARLAQLELVAQTAVEEQGKRRDAEASVAALTAQVAGLNDALETAREEAAATVSLASELEAERARVGELRASLAVAEQHLVEIRGARDEAQAEMLALDEERERLQAQLKELGAQLAHAQADATSATALLDESAREQDVLRAKVSALAPVQALAERLQAELDTERSVRREAEARLTETTTTLETTRTQAEELEATAQLAAEKVKALEAREVMSLTLPGRGPVGVARHGNVDLAGLARVVCELVLTNAEVKLELGASGGTRSLWFKRGQIIAAESTFDAEGLIGRARRDGLIDARQDGELRMLKGATPREQLDALKARAFIRDIESVPLVQRYTEQVALDAFTEEQTLYRIAEEAPKPEVLLATVPRPTLPMLAESLRRAVTPDVMLERLGGGEAVPVSTDTELDLRALGFSERERKMLGWVDAEASVEDLSLASGLKPDVAFRALLVAKLLGVIEVKPGAKKAEPTSGQLDVQRLEAKYDEVQDADYFAILGLSRAAGSEDVRRAFQRLSQEFDPLRYSGHPDAALQQRAQVVANLLEEAARALEDDRRRVEYARHLLD